MDHRERELLRIVGRNLAAERARRGLSQDDVATRMGMQMQQYSKLERGEHDSGLTKYVAAAWALDITWEELLRGVDSLRP